MHSRHLHSIEVLIFQKMPTFSVAELLLVRYGFFLLGLLLLAFCRQEKKLKKFRLNSLLFVLPDPI